MLFNKAVYMARERYYAVLRGDPYMGGDDAWLPIQLGEDCKLQIAIMRHGCSPRVWAGVPGFPASKQ
jgi:hypothetical protein